jgi:hypothetical protein
MSKNAYWPTTVLTLVSLACGAQVLAARSSNTPSAVKVVPASATTPTAKPAPRPVHAVGKPVAPTLPALTVAQIVDKNVAARGGLAAWQAAKSMSWKGMMGAGGRTYMTVTAKAQLQQKEREEMQLPFRFEFKRPLKSRLELDFNGQTAVQVNQGEGDGVDAAVGHQARVAITARKRLDGDRSFLPDHVAHDRQRAVGGGHPAHLGVPCRVPDIVHRHQKARFHGGVEHQLTCPYPVCFGVERGMMSCIVPDDFWRLLCEPLEVAGRLTAGDIDRIVLVDGRDGNSIVVVRRGMFWRSDRIRQGNFERRDRGIVPRLRDDRGAWPLLLSGGDDEGQPKR